MSHIITLSETTFVKLQTLARPFIDTPESVIMELAEAEIRRRLTSANGKAANENHENGSIHLDPDSHPSLTHSRVLSAFVDGVAIHKPKWNRLLDTIHVLARRKLQNFDVLRRKTDANIREGIYAEDGYRYLPEANISIQGVDSNIAWRHSLGLARAISVPIQVKFEWREREDAANPGQQAMLEWKPNETD